MFRNVVSKLFKTWIVIVGIVSIVGFCWFSIVVFHDSYVAYKALSKAKDTFPKIDPNGNTRWQLGLIDLKWKYEYNTVDDQLTAGCYHGALSLYKSPQELFSKKIADICRKAFTGVTISEKDDLISIGCEVGIGATLKSLNRTKEFLYWLDRNSKKCVELSHLELSERIHQKKKEFETKTGISFSKYYGAYINGQWEDEDFSNISYLLVVSLWLIIGCAIIGISYGLRKWVNWLITK